MTMTTYRPSKRDRAPAMIAALAVQALVGWALVGGLAVSMPASVTDSLAVFAVEPPPPPLVVEKAVPAPVQSDRREGAAAPPNITSTPTPLIAPPPIVVILPPPPMIVAERAGIGSDATQGAADRYGPGTGAGGVGDGTGSGGSGDGGGAGGDETPPRFRRGELSDRDYPAGASEMGAGGKVGVRYMVDIDGRVRDCEVTRSSGNAELDATTCRLIERRFRFDPSRDGRGRPVRSTIVENHEWVFERLPAEE